MTKEKIETYPEAARVIHLWLAEFCDENRTYPDMIAEASRRAAKEIERLRHLTPVEADAQNPCRFCVNAKEDNFNVFCSMCGRDLRTA